MKVIDIRDIKGTDREVRCPNGNFISNRFLLESDGMGYSVTKTEIPKGTSAVWHYKNHLESCYCVSGLGAVRADGSHTWQVVSPDSMYVLDKNDRHEFKALEDVVLICVFNPPLRGQEIHNKEGSYDV